jgi:hypothetical protein
VIAVIAAMPELVGPDGLRAPRAKRKEIRAVLPVTALACGLPCYAGIPFPPT